MSTLGSACTFASVDMVMREGVLRKESRGVAGMYTCCEKYAARLTAKHQSSALLYKLQTMCLLMMVQTYHFYDGKGGTDERHDQTHDT